MSKSVWYTLVWQDKAKTVPSTRAVWLTDCQMLSVCYDRGLYTAAVSSGKWGPVVLENCSSWAEAEVEAVKAFRSELTARIRKLQADIAFLDNNIEQTAQS